MLERLQKYSDPKTLNIAWTAALIRDNIKTKNRNDLENDHEELRVAYMAIQERFNNELQAERYKNAVLQREVNWISFVQQTHILISNTDADRARQFVANLQQQHQREVEKKEMFQKYCKEQQEAYRQSQENLRVHQENLQKICEV